MSAMTRREKYWLLAMVGAMSVALALAIALPPCGKKSPQPTKTALPSFGKRSPRPTRGASLGYDIEIGLKVEWGSLRVSVIRVDDRKYVVVRNNYDGGVAIHPLPRDPLHPVRVLEEDNEEPRKQLEERDE